MTTDRRRWFGLPFISLGVALIIVDATIINVAIPSIIDDLGITSTQAQWTQESYTLVFASLLLVFGRIADRIGRRAMFSVGIAIFAVSSIVAATVQSGDALIAARLVQGAGGAMMLPTSLSLINSTFFGKDRGIAFAVWGSTIGGAAAFGPLLGGWLTTSYSWRWAFGINIPLAVIVVAGVTTFIRESRGDSEGAKGVDIVGAFLSVLSVGAVVFGLIEGRNYGWWTSIGEASIFGWEWTYGISLVPIAFLVGAIGATVFVAVELRRNAAGQAVLLDLGLLRVTSFRNANLVAGIVSLGEFGLIFALPLWMQNVLGYSAFKTGLVLLPLALGSFFASGLGAPLGAKKGPVFVVQTGIVLEVIGLVSCGLVVSPTTSWWAIGIPLFFYGMGVGLATAQLTGVALAEIPPAQSGQGSGITSTTRQLGSALGIAVLGTILFTSFGNGIDDRLADPAIAAAAGMNTAGFSESMVQSAGAIIPSLAAQPNLAALADIAGAALSDGTRLSAFAGAAFLMLGFFASLRLRTARRVE